MVNSEEKFCLVAFGGPITNYDVKMFHWLPYGKLLKSLHLGVF